MSKVNKHKYQVITAFIIAMVGVVLIVASFIVPPQGEIHPSVLTALGVLFTFSGSLYGIDAHYKMKSDKNEIDAMSGGK